MARIADVARAAGVSASTVSYVLSGRRAISAETRARVLQAVRDLGYTPNAAAGALAGGRTRTIGLVAPRCEDLTAAIIQQFIHTIMDVARARDHDVLLLDPREGGAGLHRVIDSRLVDGVILMDTDETDRRAQILEQAGVPAVVLGTPQGTSLPCVDLDFAAAARLAVRHLATRAADGIALMSPPELVGPPGKGYARHAAHGFAAAAGPSRVVRVCEPTWTGVETWLAAVSHRLGTLTGVVVQHEAALPPLLGLLRRHHRTDVTVVPICPSAIARQLESPLDHVVIPVDAMARTAAETLLAQLTHTGRATSHVFEPHLIRAA
ncbi:LacI family transcriptional regulator [Paractinoplanes abujensis]|uniref:DNA-binding LacI/PurR family transcriptional regulator n=1 Tax=Paractinoplanes abujensis TaxID=882441 RepID=A0A7W7CMM6_9ACTN|nr:LacI family DNA-binding transcriptional regulator [Actinoplanes abujensis]MBB4691322.1 DNA-binding LacI/PurR family transcriptional regulator [Actinoplanes abujensis]GID17263.1 LacI family transcriptional regulator [Actinoplanes abujensis]